MFLRCIYRQFFESEHMCDATKIIHMLLDAKHKNSYLNKIMNGKCKKLTEQ